MRYRVLTDNFHPAKKGAVIPEQLIQDCNIAALVKGGHLEELPEVASRSQKAADVVVEPADPVVAIPTK